MRYIFTIPGVKYFLSERISQDPLENFFGCQRQRGGSSENPNVKEFCKNTQALRVVNSVCGTVSKGNSRGNKQIIDLQTENKPLPKRRKAKKQKVPIKKDLPTTLGNISFSDLTIPQSKDPEKLPDLSATGEPPLLPISKKENCADTVSACELSGLLVAKMEAAADVDMELSEDITSPDISPVTSEISDDDEPIKAEGIILSNLPTMNLSNSQAVLSPVSTEYCTDHLLGTIAEADSDMELSGSVESPGISPKHSEVPNEDKLSADFIEFDLPTRTVSENPVSNSTAAQDAMDSRLTPSTVRSKTSTEEEKITCALSAGPANERIVNLCNITLRRQDFWTLKSMEWLNDQVKSFCMMYVCAYIYIYIYTVAIFHFFVSFNCRSSTAT